MRTRPSTPADPAARARRGLAGRIASKPVSREEVEQRYVDARDRWKLAMRQATSGTPADLAALKEAEAAYVEAAAERKRWERSHERTAILVDPEPKAGIDVAVDQEVRWREVREHQDSGGLLSRLKRRLGR